MKNNSIKAGIAATLTAITGASILYDACKESIKTVENVDSNINSIKDLKNPEVMKTLGKSGVKSVLTGLKASTGVSILTLAIVAGYEAVKSNKRFNEQGMYMDMISSRVGNDNETIETIGVINSEEDTEEDDDLDLDDDLDDLDEE